ncbi:hypothetical protein NDU88_001284 [Pleurodeles waltl]|uniref:Uncharacterized protein n=1 Tax=Pleurodeles waltl TaxID=8319 RepID=A0AAV7L996_PLEWA|nr:hypothetical protein NDU88_001284 [Pleurodeles waltl]
MADKLVKKALQLLQEAGCTDLVQESALEHLRPSQEGVRWSDGSHVRLLASAVCKTGRVGYGASGGGEKCGQGACTGPPLVGEDMPRKTQRVDVEPGSREGSARARDPCVALRET